MRSISSEMVSLIYLVKMKKVYLYRNTIVFVFLALYIYKLHVHVLVSLLGPTCFKVLMGLHGRNILQDLRTKLSKHMHFSVTKLIEFACSVVHRLLLL